MWTLGTCARLAALLCFVALAARGAEPAPLAVACAADPPEGPPPLRVRFTCAPAGGAGNYVYRWDFGDGQASSSPDPVHTYPRIGNYESRVEIRSGAQSREWAQVVRVFLEQAVTVEGGGGAAEVRFEAVRGQRLRISLQGASPDMEPYGHLESASGAHYRPENEAARGGSNQWEGPLPDTGAYVLTVFDGANQGGRVTVRIEEVSR